MHIGLLSVDVRWYPSLCHFLSHGESHAISKSNIYLAYHWPRYSWGKRRDSLCGSRGLQRALVKPHPPLSVSLSGYLYLPSLRVRWVWPFHLCMHLVLLGPYFVTPLLRFELLHLRTFSALNLLPMVAEDLSIQVAHFVSFGSVPWWFLHDGFSFPPPPANPLRVTGPAASPF